MPTLYVENIPKDLYQALRKRARENHKSIAGEVISLLERNIPTSETLRRRRELFGRLAGLRASTGSTPASETRASQPEPANRFPTIEEMIRQDRGR
jgi:plasmid stability protein